MKHLIKKILKEQQQNFQYTPNIQGDPNLQAWTCVAMDNILGCNVNCTSFIQQANGQFSPDLECFMCQTWGGCQGIMNFNCNSVCSSMWGLHWMPNTPCYKCDKFGKIEKLENYSEWGTTQGPCPPGYTKNPNPCMEADDEFVRTPDEREQTDNFALGQSSDNENIDIGVEEINESYIKGLIKKVLKEESYWRPEDDRKWDLLDKDVKYIVERLIERHKSNWGNDEYAVISAIEEILEGMFQRVDR